jgi:subtilisin family serine protease
MRTLRPLLKPAAPRLGTLTLIELLESRVFLSAAFDITGLTALRQNSAFSRITGSGVGIAVLDTGVYAKNPDLQSNVVAYYNAVSQPVSAPIDTIFLQDAIDHDGHGSHVSGIAASSNPAIGVAYGAKLVDIRVIADSGESQLGGDPVLRGLQWVALHYQQFNIKVVNMSLGEPGINENSVSAADRQNAEAIAINNLQNLGIAVVTASGNSYANNPVPGASFPAVVSTISVANTWASSGQASDFGVPFGGYGDQYYAVDYSATADTFASTSQRSTLANQLAAPGEDIFSTWNGTQDSSNGSDVLHNTLSGTSMASPFVAGVVALMQNAAKTFGGRYITDTSEILKILQDTADTVVDSNNPNNARYNSSTAATSNLPETGLSYKRIDVLKAIEDVQSIVTGGAITTGPAPGPDTDNTTTTATAVNNIDGTSLFTFDGSIGTDGQVLVGAKDVDLYKLQVVSPGSLSFSLSQPAGGTAFNAALRLFDSSGNLIASTTGSAASYPTLTTPGGTPLAVGTYYVGISAVGNTAYTFNGTGAAAGNSQGDYTLTIGLQNPDPNGTVQGAVSIDLTQPNETLTDSSTGKPFTDVLEQGLLGSDPPPTGSTTRITVSSDVDMFKIVAPDTGILNLTTDTSNYSNPADTYLKVYDSNFNTVGSNDNASQFTTDSTLSLNVTIGQTYYVAVTVPQNSNLDPTNPFNGRTPDATPSDVAYDLHLRFNNGDSNGTAVSAASATIGSPVNGTIGADGGVPLLGANGGFKDVDFLSYTAASSGLFDVSATATTSGFTPVLSLWEFTPGQNSVVKVADTVTMASPHLTIQVTSGQTFFVAVTGLGNNDFNWFAVASGSGGQTGSYTLSTSLQSLTSLASVNDNSVQNGTPEVIAVGETVKGNLGLDGSLVVGNTDVDMYRLVAPATQTLDIRTLTGQEGDADTVLRVFDANGNQLAANDNVSASSTASDVQIAVVAGQTYYIGVSGAGASSMAYNPLTGANAGAGSTGNYGLAIAAAVVGFGVSDAAAVPAFAGSRATFTVTLNQPLTTSASVDYTTADGTALAGADYTTTSGTLTFPAGVTTQTVSVPVLFDASASGTRTFSLTLSNPQGAAIPSPGATGTINDVPVTTKTFSAGKPLTYRDSAHHAVTLSLAGPGTGTAVFVSGALDPAAIMLDTTNGASAFTIAGGTTTVADVVVNGSLASLAGKSADLTGALSVSGSLGKLTLRNVNGGTGGALISIGTAGPALVVNLSSVSNESLSTPGAIASLTVRNWLVSSGAPATISAASIGAIKSTSDFDASITAAALGAVKVGGSLALGTWSISGSGGNLSVSGSAESGWAATFGGALGAVRFTTDAGNLTALSIRSLTISRNLTSAVVHTTGTAGTVLGALTVGGTVSGSQILSAGNVGKVSAGTFIASNLFAGVSSAQTALPAVGTDFVSDDSIVSFTVKGTTSPVSFGGSNVAAASIGKVSIARANPDNGGTAYGFAAKSLGAFSNRGKLNWTNKKPASLLVADGDSVVRLLT